MAKTNAQNQAAYKTRMRDKGFELVPVYVPINQRNKIKEYAKSLRQGKNPG